MSHLLERRRNSVDPEVSRTKFAMTTSPAYATGAAVWLNPSRNPSATAFRPPVLIRVRFVGEKLSSGVLLEDGKLTQFEGEFAPAAQAAQWLRDALGLSMTQLANLTDVTRAAAYAWLKGTSPHANKNRNLLAMRAALSGLDAFTLRFLPQVWDYPMQDGSSLFKILRKLDSPEVAAKSIASALEFVRPRLHALVAQSGSRKPGNELGNAHTADTYKDIGASGDR